MLCRLSLFVLFLFSATAVCLGEPLTLADAERLALQRNLELRAVRFNTRASEALVRKGYGIYDPQLQVTAVAGKERERTNLAFISQTAANELEYRTLNLSVVQLLPSGGQVRAFFANRHEDSNSTSRLFNPSYQVELGIELLQPLLKDFGRSVTDRTILLASRDRHIAYQDLRQQAFDLVRDVHYLYYQTIALRDRLTYRQSSLALAEQVLRENRARLEAGSIAAVEVLEAEVGLQLRQRELLDAERLYEDALDRFDVLLNADAPDSLAAPGTVDPSLILDDGIAYRQALEKRPDLARLAEQIERSRIDAKVAQNQTLPTLDLGAGYSHKGLGEAYDDAIDDVASSDFRNWEVSLNLSYPLGNRQARNAFESAELQMNNLRAQMMQRRLEVQRQIRSARRAFEVGRRKLEVTRKAHELAEEQLRTLLGRKEVGLATTRDVLEGEEDLAAARTDQIAALAEYGQAATDYLWVTGRLLECRGLAIAAAEDGDEAVRPRAGAGE